MAPPISQMTPLQLYAISHILNDSATNSSKYAVDQEMTPLAITFVILDALTFVFFLVAITFFFIVPLSRLIGWFRKNKDPNDPLFPRCVGVCAPLDKPTSLNSPVKQLYPFMSVSCYDTDKCPRYVAVLPLLIFRILVSLWLIFYDVYRVATSDDLVYTYQFLTICGYTTLDVFYIFSAVLTLVFFILTLKHRELDEDRSVDDLSKCSSRSFSCLRCLDSCLGGCYPFPTMVSFIIAIAYWFLVVPTSGSDWWYWGTLFEHGFNTMFAISEIFILSEYYRPTVPSCCSGMAFAFGWSVWVTILVKTRYIDQYPYNGLMSYDVNWWGALVKYVVAGGLAFGWVILVLVSWAKWSIVMKPCCGGGKNEEEEEVLNETLELNEA